ncbi:MAG: hypothetical protein J7L31_00930 [Thermoplasmata archaeon]|nr:hypothetical protein [Thermoplasmata archaeon]
MMDIHRFAVAAGIFVIIPLLLLLLFVSSILSIMHGDGSGFIGLAIALLFLIMDVWVIIQYRKDRDATLERDIRARVWRDALAPVALSTFFLFLSILNLFAGDREGMMVFFVLFAALLLVGIIFYLQKRKIIG